MEHEQIHEMEQEQIHDEMEQEQIHDEMEQELGAILYEVEEITD